MYMYMQHGSMMTAVPSIATASHQVGIARLLAVHRAVGDPHLGAVQHVPPARHLPTGQHPVNGQYMDEKTSTIKIGKKIKYISNVLFFIIYWIDLWYIIVSQ